MQIDWAVVLAAEVNASVLALVTDIVPVAVTVLHPPVKATV
jgi:hypothetical protein